MSQLFLPASLAQPNQQEQIAQILATLGASQQKSVKEKPKRKIGFVEAASRASGIKCGDSYVPVLEICA